MLRGDGGERHAKRHLAPKCGPVRKSVEFGLVALDGLLQSWTSALVPGINSLIIIGIKDA